jgi:hypothetical protein
MAGAHSAGAEASSCFLDYETPRSYKNPWQELWTSLPLTTYKKVGLSREGTKVAHTISRVRPCTADGGWTLRGLEGATTGGLIRKEQCSPLSDPGLSIGGDMPCGTNAGADWLPQLQFAWKAQSLNPLFPKKKNRVAVFAGRPFPSLMYAPRGAQLQPAPRSPTGMRCVGGFRGDEW